MPTRKLMTGKSDRALAFTAARFAEATRLSLVSVDCRGDIEFVNPAACHLFGYTQAEMIGQPITIIIPERLRGAHMVGLQKVADGNAPHLGGRAVEVSAIRKDGIEFPIEITLSTWQGPRGFCAGAVITDISERREREGRLLHMASQDTLTGLMNRRQFLSLLSDAMAAGRPFSVLVLDLDGFKEVNDTHGHLVGDTLLQAIGVRLPYMLKETAQVARIGGDEFAILLDDTNNPLEAHQQAQLVRDGFQKPFELAGHALEVGTSIGIALYPAHGQEADELIASADFALCRAKADGSGVRLYDQTMRSEVSARRALRDELLQALRQGELELFYQPQVHLRTGRTIGLEGLLRWNHPQHGLLSPSAFLPALDQSALALEIGWWTLDEAVKRASELQRAGHNIRVGVNLFPGQLRAPNLIHKVANALQRHSLRPDLLELEVTETIALADNDRSYEAMKAVRELGVGLAFDDFGTGYASLSSLQRYPITTLKIDRGFLRHIDSQASDVAITRALIGLGRDMGLETIAEGIETREQEGSLIALGCPCGQGYLYGKPMPFTHVFKQLEITRPVRSDDRKTLAG